MITDEQGIEWLLQKLYDDGWRYYAKNIGGVAYLTTKRASYKYNRRFYLHTIDGI